MKPNVARADVASRKRARAAPCARSQTSRSVRTNTSALDRSARDDAGPQATPPDITPSIAGSVAGAQRYRLDGASSLIVQTSKDGAAARLAHDHAIRASAFSGEATWHPAAPTELALDVTVKTASLRVDDDAARIAVGLEPGVDEDDKKQVDAAMKGAEQLDVERFADIRFRATSLAIAPDGTQQLTGDFTLKGVTRRVSMPVTIAVRRDGTLRGTASFPLRLSDYGITPYSAFSAL